MVFARLQNQMPEANTKAAVRQLIYVVFEEYILYGFAYELRHAHVSSSDVI